jgi:hypothetical protein
VEGAALSKTMGGDIEVEEMDSFGHFKIPTFLFVGLVF